MNDVGAAQATKAMLSFAGRNPDVLTCIANLSNDEVFTPPELANRMLDLVADAWAADNDGASIWADPTVTFLDPATKSGVFLREITKRLVEGLADRIPDLQERVDHILTTQVFGIGITELTAMLARRSLYCSKWATRTEQHPHSIATGFDTDDGNVWFERTEHTWVKGRCTFCGAGESALGRGHDLESHAYAFIHTDDIKARVAELFGDDMKFDVIVGNPPYQLEADAAGQNVMPIYNRFVDQAKALEPRLITMVTPSRWMAGGKWLDEFRHSMLTDRRLANLIDFPNSAEVFPSVDLKGGVSYFLWESDRTADGSSTSLVRNGETIGPLVRNLGEFDVFVRDPRAIPILRKVLAKQEPSLADIVSPRDPFGPALSSNFTGYVSEPLSGFLRLHMPGRGLNRWVDPGLVTKSEELVDAWKVLMPKAGPGNSGGHVIPDIVLGRPITAAPQSVCTLSYLAIGPLADEGQAEALGTYLRSRFARFLVSLRKPSQDAPRGVYRWVPMQTWDRTWTDEELYTKYKLTKAEIGYIESMIRPMELADD